MSGRRAMRRGFTIVEVLVAVVILGLGLLALSQLYIAGMITYTKARDMSLATQRASLELEHAQNLTYNLLYTAMDPADPKLVPNLYDESIYTDWHEGTGATHVYGVDYTVSDLPNGRGTTTFQKYNGYDNLIQVTVNIEWDGVPRAESKVEVTTLIANK